MTLRELEEERARLREQIVSLTLITLDPDMAPIRALEHDAPGRAFLNHLEEQLEEKKARLRELDERIERASSPIVRIRELSRRWLYLLWVNAILALTAWFLVGTVMDELSSKALGASGLFLLIWALWVTLSPKP